MTSPVLKEKFPQYRIAQNLDAVHRTLTQLPAQGVRKRVNLAGSILACHQLKTET